jgi:hypothetical protein
MSYDIQDLYREKLIKKILMKTQEEYHVDIYHLIKL